MMKKFAVAALMIGSSFGTCAIAQAMDFPATPLNSGAPTNLPGETIIPGMTQAMMIVNGVTQPILQPILAPGPVAMAAPEPMMRKRHMSRRMMMKKKMMMKKEMMMKKGM